MDKANGKTKKHPSRRVHFLLQKNTGNDERQIMTSKEVVSLALFLAKVLQTTPNYLLGFADNNDGFADEALGLLRDVKDQSVRESLLKQIRALI